MAKLFRQTDATELALPGRKSSEIVSGAGGADRVSFRMVEIAPAAPGEKPRGPHVHHTFEECIFVLAGEGVMDTPRERLPLAAGDTVLVPAGERHVTRNTGREPLRLLCFFPTGDVAWATEEFPDWNEPGAAS